MVCGFENYKQIAECIALLVEDSAAEIECARFIMFSECFWFYHFMLS
jgi:hypothetical protein